MRPYITPLISTALLISFAGMGLANATGTVPTIVSKGDATPAHYDPHFEQWYEMVLPGQRLDITLAPQQTLIIDGRPWTEDWRAPKTPQKLSATLRSGDKVLATLNIFVLEPYTNIGHKGWLNGYRIGFYPRNPPLGFIRLNGPDDRLHALSPHFKVGQFLCKQQPKHWPKYVIVSQDNIRRLEALLTSLNDDRTTEADTFFVMSGFRTPFYNTAIGSAKYSRHMYGDAADIYVDYTPRNGTMDDLNRDGQIDKTDANWLYDYAQQLFKTRRELPKGGLGSYRANAVHGPFIHVDGRGSTARWGR